ncbi:phytanoyl-CoA dioxygenase family protein [Paenibacillus cymbidii]|uniref:phytanoyl-CoA dioxygenase family protein n=1 Tax=Paenibacillus cymbidii TaxID=1639034 RepID=UPI0010822784|nr:phytanoyl-CoA dioxygenase family protein [Paenibacillus cymbidii]
MCAVQLDIPALVKQFHEEGYLILPGVLSEDKVARLNRAVDAVVAQQEESVAYNIYNCIELDPELASLIDEPTILPLMVNIMGFNIQFFISNLSVRKPNPHKLQANTFSSIPWHQDGPTPVFPSVNGITPMYYARVCYILSDMSEPGRGNTKVIPRSHKRPYYNPNQTDISESVEGEVVVCGKPGDVFIFAQNLWHGGTPNHSTSYTRTQLFYGYSYIWMRPNDYRAPSDRLLQGASPYRRQLLGQLESDDIKRYYSNGPNRLPPLPLQELWLEPDKERAN